MGRGTSCRNPSLSSTIRLHHTRGDGFRCVYSALWPSYEYRLGDVGRNIRRSSTQEPTIHQQVLSFWFDETDPKLWWSADPTFDALIRKRFLNILQQASAGELFHWRATPEGRLAEIIVLDQFSRNVYRNTPLAFAQDSVALVLAQEAVAAGALESLAPMQRSFLLMPYMHSESKLIHVEAEALFKNFAPAGNHDFELRHKAIIDRFGRYPHRNEILGRASTPEELAFLQQPGSRF